MADNTLFEVIGFEKVDKKWLDARPNLKVIGCNATSLEHIDLKECEKRNIKIISLAQPRDKETKEFLKEITSTAEHTFGLMISLLRNYKTCFKSEKRCEGNTLKEKTLGIIGYGRIGKQIKLMTEGLGMNVIWAEDMTQIYNILPKADIVSLHIPLKQNSGFFTKYMFERMKPTAYFINTSRDEIVEKGALIYALKSNIIKGAAVDFMEDRGLVEYAKTHDNLILTNHLGGNTFEDTQKTKQFIINKIKKYLNEN